LDNFSVISQSTLWTGTGSTDWLGRPVLLDDGSKWIVIYRQGAQHAYDAASVFHIRFSTDQGATWTAEDTYIGGGAVAGAPAAAAPSPAGMPLPPFMQG